MELSVFKFRNMIAEKHAYTRNATRMRKLNNNFHFPC